MRILELEDNILKISPEALGLSFFNKLWSKDKSKDKSKAYKDICYVFYYTDFNSPFFKDPPDQREGLIKRYIIADEKFNVDNDIKEAIKGYEEVTKTPAMKMLESVTIAMDKMDNYFKTVKFEGGDDEIDKVQKAIINMPKMIAAVNEAKEACRKETIGSTRVRGNATVGMFEDKK
jgi:hypothetical protein